MRGSQKGVAQMAWEDRNGRRYYYRKRREGNRVVSEYVGGGFSGQFAEILDLENRRETEHKRRELQKQKRQAAAIDRQVDQAGTYTQAITRACLLLAGYHTHKGQWRKRRDE
jgi:hypothetical protein